MTMVCTCFQGTFLNQPFSQPQPTLPPNMASEWAATLQAAEDHVEAVLKLAIRIKSNHARETADFDLIQELCTGRAKCAELKRGDDSVYGLDSFPDITKAWDAVAQALVDIYGTQARSKRSRARAQPNNKDRLPVKNPNFLHLLDFCKQVLDRDTKELTSVDSSRAGHAPRQALATSSLRNKDLQEINKIRKKYVKMEIALRTKRVNTRMLESKEGTRGKRAKLDESKAKVSSYLQLAEDWERELEEFEALMYGSS